MDKRSIQGVHFLRLHGNAVERGRAHGVLLKTEIQDGALPALSKKNEWLIRTGPGLVQNKIVQDAVVWFYRKIFMPWLDRRTSAEFRRVMHAVAFESGVPYWQCRESVFQAEAMMLMSRLSVMKYLLRDFKFHEALPGCSSAVVDGSWTQSGRLLACRNMDYPIVGPWEKHTTVLFHEPTERWEIPHVAVTTAGVHTAGLTAMNREGLTLATHAHFTRKYSLMGKPIITIGNEVIRRAKTIGEAVDIIRKMKRIGNWSFVLSSAKEKRGVVVEMGPGAEAVREMVDGYVAHTNFFHSRGVRDEEALISGACTEDIWGRYCRMREILEPLRKSIEPTHMAGALADSIDPETGEMRVVGNTLAVVTTLKSVIFDPEMQRFWISTRHESPTSHGGFLEVNVDRFWREDPPHESYPMIREHRVENVGHSEAMTHYRNAFRSMHILNDRPGGPAAAIESLKKAVAAFPSDGNLWVSLGIVSFSQKKFKEAQDAFAQALERKLGTHIGQVARLFTARCLDLAGQREQALALYAKEAEVKVPQLRDAYRQGMKRPYTVGRLSSLMIDLQFPDALQY